MDNQELIKNLPFSEPHLRVGMVDYRKGRVVSLTFAETNVLSLTLFAFDQGEGLSTHTTSGDAMVQVLEGEVSLMIGGKEVMAKSGEVVAMPADVPHSLNAATPFKMLLTVIKKPVIKKPLNRGTRYLPFSPSRPPKKAA
ncbi:MAG: cupin domain-containing protein [Deltaproteobacteria bacterium HGW-Deltaproteobacteria-15]|nr:MAG: cupin domain-containing protein [Deltaproteobacteria bacterium HGW-Deltaproteobacteria-15]